MALVLRPVVYALGERVQPRVDGHQRAPPPRLLRRAAAVPARAHVVARLRHLAGARRRRRHAGRAAPVAGEVRSADPRRFCALRAPPLDEEPAEGPADEQEGDDYGDGDTRRCAGAQSVARGNGCGADAAQVGRTGDGGGGGHGYGLGDPAGRKGRDGRCLGGGSGVICRRFGRRLVNDMLASSVPQTSLHDIYRINIPQDATQRRENHTEDDVALESLEVVEELGGM